MELVIDANVLISALIKNGHTRHFLILSGHAFYVPEFVFEEIKEYMDEIKQKTALSESEIKEVLEQIILVGNIKVIPFEEFKENPEKQLSPTLKGGDLRRFSETDFLKSNVAKSIAAFIPTHKWLGFLLI